MQLTSGGWFGSVFGFVSLRCCTKQTSHVYQSYHTIELLYFLLQLFEASCQSVMQRLQLFSQFLTMNPNAFCQQRHLKEGAKYDETKHATEKTPNLNSYAPESMQIAAWIRKEFFLFHFHTLYMHTIEYVCSMDYIKCGESIQSPKQYNYKEALTWLHYRELYGSRLISCCSGIYITTFSAIIIVIYCAGHFA